jgi:hypothetical protein
VCCITDGRETAWVLQIIKLIVLWDLTQHSVVRIHRRFGGKYCLKFEGSSEEIVNIVAHRPVAKQWLCKQRPLLRNVRNIHATIEERCFLWSEPRLFLGNGSLRTRSRGNRHDCKKRRTVFSIWFVPRRYNQGRWSNEFTCEIFAWQ